jgi:hypothetical protein
MNHNVFDITLTNNFQSVIFQWHHYVFDITLTNNFQSQCFFSDTIMCKHIMMSLKKHWLWKLSVSVMSNTLWCHWKNTDSGNYQSVWCQTHYDVITLTDNFQSQCFFSDIVMCLTSHWPIISRVSVFSVTS